LVIPSELIDDDNVLRVTYNDVTVPIEEGEEDLYFDAGFDANDYILSREDITSDYLIEAHQHLHMLGEITYVKSTNYPIAVHNGKHISYRAYMLRLEKMRNGKDTTSSYIYLDGREGQALYGKKAQYGLYIFFDYKIP
jgi:hypothetical protein